MCLARTKWNEMPNLYHHWRWVHKLLYNLYISNPVFTKLGLGGEESLLKRQYKFGKYWIWVLQIIALSPSLKSTFLGGPALRGYKWDTPNPVFSKLGGGGEECQLTTSCKFGIPKSWGGHSTTLGNPKLHKPWHFLLSKSLWFVILE